MSPILRPLLLFALCFSPLAHSADAPATKLKYGAWGFDLSGMDQKTKSGDDFFRYANGTWLDKTQIPPDKSAYSMRIIMTDFTEQRLRELMEASNPTGNPATLQDVPTIRAALGDCVVECDAAAPAWIVRAIAGNN